MGKTVGKEKRGEKKRGRRDKRERREWRAAPEYTRDPSGTQALRYKRKYDTCLSSTKQKELDNPQPLSFIHIMLPFLFLPTFLILFSLSATARPLIYPRAPALSPPPAHVPSQPYHSDLVLADRRLFSPPHSSGPIDAGTSRSLRRFIMDADYAHGSSQPAFQGTSSRKREDSLSDTLGSTTIGYDDLHEEFPPKVA